MSSPHGLPREGRRLQLFPGWNCFEEAAVRHAEAAVLRKDELVTVPAAHDPDRRLLRVVGSEGDHLSCEPEGGASAFAAFDSHKESKRVCPIGSDPFKISPGDS